MTTKQQERQALEKIRKIVEGLGEGSYVGTAMEGVLETAEQNIEQDAAFSLEGQKRVLEKELEAQVQKASGLEAVVEKQRKEITILYEDIAEASRMAARWHMSQEMYRLLVGIIKERMEMEAQMMEKAADAWADGAGGSGGADAQAEGYRKHREQRGICRCILRELGRYEEQKAGND